LFVTLGEEFSIGDLDEVNDSGPPSIDRIGTGGMRRRKVSTIEPAFGAEHGPIRSGVEREASLKAAHPLNAPAEAGVSPWPALLPRNEPVTR
jgi:hypothetical protein